MQRVTIPRDDDLMAGLDRMIEQHGYQNRVRYGRVATIPTEAGAKPSGTRKRPAHWHT